MLLWDRLMLTTAHDLHKCAVPPNGPVSKLDALVHLWYRPKPQELSVECICVSLCSSSSHSWWGQKIKAGKPCVFVWASEGGVFMDKRIRQWGKNGGISRSETGVKEGDKKEAREDVELTAAASLYLWRVQSLLNVYIYLYLSTGVALN